MLPLITRKADDPLGHMMLDYYHGDLEACIEVESENMEMTTMSGATMFRKYPYMTKLEQYALERCRGKTLDVGAGSGCHSLHLQELGHEVDALDISPGCIEVMKKREVDNPLHKNLFSLNERKYTTILMLMNGLGICGTLDRLNLFLQLARTLLMEEGHIIADSTDLNTHLEPDESWEPSGKYYGETEFVMRYRDAVSQPFNWLYIDYATLHDLAAFNGFYCEQLMIAGDGQYLVRMYPL